MEIHELQKVDGCINLQSGIKDVSVDLSVKIIEEHKKAMTERLIELNAIAKIELTEEVDKQIIPEK